MKSFSFAFSVAVFLLAPINCDVNSSLNRNRTFFSVNNISRGPSLGTRVQKPEADAAAKACLKEADRCWEEDLDHEATTNHLSNFLFATAPPFDLSQNKKVSTACRRQSEKYLEDLKRFKLWALKMYDSSAKLPTGILNGNINHLGDFDLCLQASENNQKINAQYCLASIQIETKKASPYVAALHRLVQSHFHFKSHIDDPGHRVPRFSSINWAVCMPDSCTSSDVESGLRDGLNKIFKNTDLDFRVQVEPHMCQSTQQKDFPISTIIAVCFFTGLILFEVGAAIYDYVAVGAKNRWVMAFSLKNNIDSLLTIKRSSDDIEAIHGIRFLNAFLLMLAHKCMAIFFVPYTNRTEMVEFVARPWTVLGRAASLYTDPFILISGTLTAYSFLGKLMKEKKLNIVEEYISRLMRIVPTFASLIAFCTLVLPWLSSGPMWNQVVTHHSEICKRYWWRNLLFIHNYFGFKDMCLTHTHHVGIDTQLFFVSPLFVLLLWKWPKKGVGILVFIALASTAFRYYVTYTMKLSNYIHFGTSITQLFQTADNMYILPVHRATVYIMGVLLGYLLRNCRNISITKSQLRVGNTLALLSFLGSFLSPAFMGSIDYVYDPTDAAWYAAFTPILWCFSFAWIIYTCHIGHTGFFERLFSRPIFTLWTKISYTVYLTQFPVFFFNVGIARTSEHYGFFRMLFNLKELLWIFLLSIILTLFIELPFQNIRNIAFSNKRKSNNDNEVFKKIR